MFFRRAAIGATALVSLLALGGAGAFAQSAEPAASIEAMPIDLDQNMVRFVASEVVQPLPDETVGTTAETDNEDSDTIETADSLHDLVGAMPPAGDMSGDVRCLAQAVYFEARGEPLDGQLAVARVIINRAESGLFPDNYCDVVTQRGQFSFVRNGRIPSPNQASSAWTLAKAVARIADEELWDSEVEDALFFHAKRVRPAWAARKIARATIDSHIFYR
ncbi:cell wall hydrolase [Croceibacterium xixiisoli]|nr:cell wall hydrolase [Croceibacterium xixiisoli]